LSLEEPADIKKATEPSIVRTVRGSAQLLNAVWLRGLLFVLVLAVSGRFGQPWGLGWLRADEAEEIAENFLLRQGTDLDKYTLIRSSEHRRFGAWNKMEESPVEVGNPAVGYVLRYFEVRQVNGWTISVSPAGHIYRVSREQLDDEPGLRVDESTAHELVETRMASDLGLPVEQLTLLRDTLHSRPQRSDWEFVYALGDSPTVPRLRVVLSGDALTDLTVLRPPGSSRSTSLKERNDRNVPDRAGTNRIIGFIFVLAGAFIIWQFHKAPLATSQAGVAGGAMFLLVLLSRGLLFPQSLLFMPSDVPYAGYLARIALSAVVEAMQAAIIIGICAATGDSAMRDHLPRTTSITRYGKKIRSWAHAWANGARWALPAATVMIVLEVTAMRIFGPVGMYSKIPPILAGTLSSPSPIFALPVQLAHDVLWDEGVFRLWLLPFTLLFFRPWLGVLVSAGLVTYWTGFDLTQIAQPGFIAYVLWNAVAGLLVVRSGILAAVLFHFFMITGLAAISVVWIGFDWLAAALLVAIILIAIGLIGWPEEKLVRQAQTA
jgi:hypothetical protein